MGRHFLKIKLNRLLPGSSTPPRDLGEVLCIEIQVSGARATADSMGDPLLIFLERNAQTRNRNVFVEPGHSAQKLNLCRYYQAYRGAVKNQQCTVIQDALGTECT